MLPDVERKLLRILFNFSHTNNRMPTIEEIQRKTGRKKNDIIFALSELEKEGFIIWEIGKIDSIQIINAWEKIESYRHWHNTLD